jgi:hypothetical protein
MSWIVRASFVSSLLAVSSSAFAWDGTVYIDCHDFAVAKSSSPDPIKITIKEGDKVLTSTSVNLQSKYNNMADPGTCPVGLVTTAGAGGLLPSIAGFSASQRKVTVTFTATGDNAIWIDRILVDSSDALTDKTYGVDGKSGWCLSTDTSDTFGGDRQDGKCQKSVSWTFENTKISF